MADRHHSRRAAASTRAPPTAGARNSWGRDPSANSGHLSRIGVSASIVYLAAEVGVDRVQLTLRGPDVSICWPSWCGFDSLQHHEGPSPSRPVPVISRCSGGSRPRRQTRRRRTGGGSVRPAPRSLDRSARPSTSGSAPTNGASGRTTICRLNCWRESTDRCSEPGGVHRKRRVAGGIHRYGR